MGRRRRSFTLIELFLSISLIALCGSIVLLRAKPMLDYSRMNHGFEKLRREMAFSKRLAKTANTDVEFEIKQKGSRLVCIRRTDEPLRLDQSINIPFVIPYLHLENAKQEILFITPSGWISNDKIINVYLGKQKRSIDTRSLAE